MKMDVAKPGENGCKTTEPVEVNS
uniref:Uncharacterized protein n=1 Tax=Anguilla anguilla TaxID=7936 RepID=A0A0E9PML6_ANGAN